MYYAAPQQRRNFGRGLLEFIRSVVTSAMVLVAASLIFLVGSNVLKNNAGRIGGAGNTAAVSSRAQADSGVSGYAPKEYDRVSLTDCTSDSGFWGFSTHIGSRLKTLPAASHIAAQLKIVISV